MIPRQMLVLRRVIHTARAAVCESIETGQVRVRDWSLPEVKSGEVLVSCRAAGMNFGELLQLVGQYQEKLVPPFVPGNEMSGVVEAVGPGVTQVQPGDAVVALPRGGAWATRAVVPETAVLSLGTGEVDFAKAAALSVTYGTAYLALKHRARLVPGETVLVTAAAGGVGTAAVELARHLGAGRVVAATGDESKAQLAVDRGADVGLVYERDQDPRDFRENKLKPLGGVDVVIDTVGGELFEPLLRSLNFNGRYVVVGFASGGIPSVKANLLLVKNLSVVGVYWGAHARHDPQLFAESITTVADLWRQGQIDPHVGATFALDDVGLAVEAFRARRTTGKVVLLP